jgi:hypothetical protein
LAVSKKLMPPSIERSTSRVESAWSDCLPNVMVP